MKPSIVLQVVLLTAGCSCDDKDGDTDKSTPDSIERDDGGTDADTKQDTAADEDAGIDGDVAADEDAEIDGDAAVDEDADTDRDAGSDNQTPIAEPQDVSTEEDSDVEIALRGSDPDGDPLTYKIRSEPANGTLRGNPPDLTYTPKADFNGKDKFDFSVSDGSAESDAVTVSIAVEPVNDVPVAEPQRVTTDEDTAVDISLSGDDVDEDALTFDIQNQPDHGELVESGDSWNYEPDDNYNGEDSFTFTVDDGASESDAVTVSIQVEPVNDRPVAEPQTVTTVEDTTIAITLVSNDVDGDRLRFDIRSIPENGTLTGSGREWIYEPEDDFNGEDGFTYSVSDGQSNSDTVPVSITVTNINDAPMAEPQTVTVEEDSEVEVTLIGTDIDGDALTFTIQDQPANGTLSGSGDRWTYLPHEDFNGSDRFDFSVNDGQTESEAVTISVAVTPINDAPSADSQMITVAEDSTVEIALSGTDVDGDGLTFAIRNQPDNGTLSGSDNDWIYEPQLNYNGADSFTFSVNDGTTDSAEATVSIEVSPVNDRPTADDQRIVTEEDTAVSFTITGSDIEGSPLTYSIVSEPNHGALSGTAPNLTFTPDSDFKGRDGFTFRVNDGELNSETARVMILAGFTRPNILIIIGDDMGIDTTTDIYPGLIDGLLNIYGDSAISGNSAFTPVLRDRIFDQGVMFDNTWGQQTCSPMRASAFTGLFGNKTNVGFAGGDLTPHQINMAQQLYDQGYSTGMFGKWHLGQNREPSKPCDVGFEVFRGNLEGVIVDFWDYTYQVQSLDSEGNPSELIDSDAPEVTITIGDTDVETTYAPAVKVIDTMEWILSEESEDPDKPWFAWLAFNTPHTPLHEPEDVFLDPVAQAELASCRPYCSDAQLLRSMINAMDTVVGVLLDEVEALDPNTIVIFVGDNGTVRSSIDNMYLTTRRRGKMTNYESGIRIPLALRGPSVQQGVVSAEYVHVVDLFATVLELAGILPPTVNYAYYDESVEIDSDSVSLVPILDGTNASVRDPVFDYILSERFVFSPSAAARNGTYKIICWDGSCSEHSFYNLIDDPLEEYPLETSGITCPAVATATQDSLEESFCRLRNVILTESYFSR